MLIIGGGINGCAIAREAALLGLSVLLVERDDLAQHTSSASTKLIHGGLRYLEHYDVRLVHEALQEREVLMRAAPHLIQPLAFVLPHAHAVRPWWLVRAGLYLYDLLAWGTSLPRSRGLKKSDAAYRAPLRRAGSGFVYYDAFVDDARLTLANAADAAANGADIRTRVALEGARRGGDVWHATLSDGTSVTARAIVNAAGPWVTDALGRLGRNAAAQVRLVKGSHIVVRKLYDGDHAYILQQPDRRIVFATPWQGDYTAIGTTDVPVERPEDARIDADEVAYLCDAANRYFTRAIAPGDVVSDWSGVRPLYDDGAGSAQAVTRDYVLDLDAAGAPLLSIFGGKITTARHLAEEAVAKLAPALGANAHPVTRARPFPGGTIADLDGFVATVRANYPDLGEDRARRMAKAYGALLPDVLGDGSLGADLGHGLTEREVAWMVTREWARSAEDVLDRRSKLGLVADAAMRARVEEAVRAALTAA